MSVAELAQEIEFQKVLLLSLDDSVVDREQDEIETKSVILALESRLQTQKQVQRKPIASKSVTSIPMNFNTDTNISSLTFTSYFRSHNIIGIYNTGWSDLLLATSADDRFPLCYISTHSWGGNDIELHAKGEANSPIIATVNFHAFSSSSTIAILGPAVKGINNTVTEKITQEGFFTFSWSIRVSLVRLQA